MNYRVGPIIARPCCQNHAKALAALRKVLALEDDPMRGVKVRLPFNLEAEIHDILNEQPKPIGAPRMLLTLALGLLLSWAAYSCQHLAKGSAVNVAPLRASVGLREEPGSYTF